MKRYFLTLMAVSVMSIANAQQSNSDTSKPEVIDSVQLVMHANDYRILVNNLQNFIDSKSATAQVLQFLQSALRKYPADKPKQVAKPNKEQPK